MKQTPISNKLAKTISENIAYLNGCPDTGSENYFSESGKYAINVFRKVNKGLPLVIHINIDENKRAIDIVPGDIEMHKKAIKSIYGAVHSFVHEYNLKLISPNTLEAQLG